MNEIMEIEEAADYLKCCVHTLRNKAKCKEIPFRFIGGKYIFSKTALNVWLAGGDTQMIVNELLKRR